MEPGTSHGPTRPGVPSTLIMAGLIALPLAFAFRGGGTAVPAGGTTGEIEAIANVVDEVRTLSREIQSLKMALAANSSSFDRALQGTDSILLGLDSMITDIWNETPKNPMDMTVQICATNTVLASRQEGVHLSAGAGNTTGGPDAEALVEFDITGGASADIAVIACMDDWLYPSPDSVRPDNAWGQRAEYENNFAATTDLSGELLVDLLRGHLVMADNYRNLHNSVLLGNIDVFLDAPTGIDSSTWSPHGTGSQAGYQPWSAQDPQASDFSVWDSLGPAAINGLPGSLPVFTFDSLGKLPPCPPGVCDAIDSLVNSAGALDSLLTGISDAVQGIVSDVQAIEAFAQDTLRTTLNNTCSGVNTFLSWLQPTQIGSDGERIDFGSWSVVTGASIDWSVPKLNVDKSTIGIGDHTVGDFSVTPFDSISTSVCQEIM